VLAVAYAAYLAIFLPLLPADGSRLGHDYALHLPNLLAGTFFFHQNGPWQVPWFSPGQCGGVPFFADLNVGYYSVPQILALVIDPLTAVRVSFAAFAAIGGVGMYVLARARFDASRAASVAAAVVFLFNGFYVYRLAIGHLTFHPVMLTPWLAFVLLPGARSRVQSGAVVSSVLGGALFAYMFEAGTVHGIVPLALAVALILLARGQILGHAWRPWIAFAGAAIVAVALSSARLVAALAFLRDFPRSDYPLPGFADPWTALRIAFEGVFWLPPADSGWAALVNKLYLLQQHEWEYGVGPAAAMLIAAGLVAIVAAWAGKGDRGRRLLRAVPVVLGFLAILLLPVALNWYAPGWNAFLKRVPLLESSSTLIRWFALYVPLAALFAGLAIDRAFSASTRPVAMLAVAVSVLALNAFSDKRFYAGQTYDATAIIAAWRSVTTGAAGVPITALAASDTGAHVGNNAIAEGQSQIRCYQPMFGYRLEHFDPSNLHVGPITDVDPAGNLNLKNPACYLYPGENTCRPGALFPATAIAEATAFAAYRPFAFQVSLFQRAADWLNLAALLACLAVLALAPLRRRRQPGRLDANRPPG